MHGDENECLWTLAVHDKVLLQKNSISPGVTGEDHSDRVKSNEDPPRTGLSYTGNALVDPSRSAGKALASMMVPLSALHTHQDCTRSPLTGLSRLSGSCARVAVLGDLA